jgi:hypothetical protein
MDDMYVLQVCALNLGGIVTGIMYGSNLHADPHFRAMFATNVALNAYTMFSLIFRGATQGA